MKRIHKLESNISNKIAAGEVVERPAAVVKELVENAIDAGATKLTIEIKKAGKTLIRVTDNGGGIDSDDVDLAFERHATSKIDTVEDIYKVATLGFRGEALASICAVSNLDVITRQKDKETGVKLSMSGGRKLSKEETGCPVGTTMVVKDLFFNTPARLKFLKSDNAEITAISDIVNKLALSHSEIGFRYLVNDKNMFATPGKGDLFKSVYAIYEKEMSRNLIEINKSENGVHIKGYMTNLQYTRGNRSMQNFFVNGRYVKSPILMEGLSMAYRTMLTPGRFPACFIMVEIDHAKVDVNIHPAKTEIKFHQESIVKQIMYSAVRETLLSFNQTPVVEISDDQMFRKVVMEESGSQAINKPATQAVTHSEIKSEIQASVRPEYGKNPNSAPNTLYNSTKNEDETNNIKKVEGIRSHPVYEDKVDPRKTVNMESKIREDDHTNYPIKNKQAQFVKAESTKNTFTKPAAAENVGFDYKDMIVQADPFKKNDPFIKTDMVEKKLEDIAVIQDTIQDKAEIYQGLRYIGQMFMTYLIFEKEGRMYLIDQHAAHEKILYERLLKQYRKSALDRQILLDPVLIELSYSEHGSVMSQVGDYEKLGLAVDDFGGNTIVIREIPALLDRTGAEALFRKAADRLKHDVNDEVSPTSEKLEKIMQESCKTAIKAHDHMADMEVDTLLDQLMTLHDPYTCPHGRPIIISITKSEIEKKFKRT